jgi:hypothetical protein
MLDFTGKGNLYFPWMLMREMGTTNYVFYWLCNLFRETILLKVVIVKLKSWRGKWRLGFSLFLYLLWSQKNMILYGCIENRLGGG